MKENEYKCASCEVVYEKGWTDEESMSESKAIWGEIPQEKIAVICDDCFSRRTLPEVKLMGEEYKKNAPVT